MKIADAIKIRDEERKRLIGKPFDNKRPDWEIKDVIVATRQTAMDVYDKIWDKGITNDKALTLVTIDEDNFDVIVISHQWPGGSGDLLIEPLESYNKHNPI